jgi:Virulence factor BrkB
MKALAQVSMLRIRQSQPTSSGREAADRPDCSLLPRNDAAHQYRRQIIFQEDNANSRFLLGSQRVDQHDRLVTDGRNIAPTEFQHGMDYTGDDFPLGLHACATLHRGEVWELVNTTDESGEARWEINRTNGGALWPLLFVGVGVSIALIYRYGPSRKEPPQGRWVTSGSALAAVMWLVMSILFPQERNIFTLT